MKPWAHEVALGLGLVAEASTRANGRVAMVVVWIVLAVLGLLLGIAAVSGVFGIGGGVGAGRLDGSTLLRIALAVAVLAGLFVVAYSERRTWMIVLSCVVLGLLALLALFSRLIAPPVERLGQGELAGRLEEYVNGPGPHALSLVVQGNLVSTIRGDYQIGVLPRGRFARHHLVDATCAYCFVEERLAGMLEAEGASTAAVQGYRQRLLRGPTVEVHMRRPDGTEPWRLELVAPNQQPSWDSKFGTGACETHRPSGTR